MCADCAVQRDERGLEKVVEDAKYRMSRYGVKPNLLVIPPQAILAHPNPASNTHCPIVQEQGLTVPASLLVRSWPST